MCRQVQEWLCLGCQTQRALEEMETHPKATTAPSTLQQVQAPLPDRPAVPMTVPASVQNDGGTRVKEAVNVSEDQTVSKPVTEKEPDPTIGSVQVSQPPDTLQTTSSLAREPETSKQESGIFSFGFGKSHPAPSRPSEPSAGKFFGLGGLTETPSSQSAVSGKVLGFGSSIFSSASNLISLSVQDKPSTADVSRTISQAAVEIPSTSHEMSRDSQETKPDEKFEATTDSDKQKEKTTDAKSEVVEDRPSVLPPNAMTVMESKCTVCEVKLNMGQERPPNFSTCTQCKNIVCNRCGFDPTPDQIKVRKSTHLQPIHIVCICPKLITI